MACCGLPVVIGAGAASVATIDNSSEQSHLVEYMLGGALIAGVVFPSLQKQSPSYNLTWGIGGAAASAVLYKLVNSS